eukprot:COSAG02_NODE_86_length_39084_cov_17.815724_36_plen_102_part_00
MDDGLRGTVLADELACTDSGGERRGIGPTRDAKREGGGERCETTLDGESNHGKAGRREGGPERACCGLDTGHWAGQERDSDRERDSGRTPGQGPREQASKR